MNIAPKVLTKAEQHLYDSTEAWHLKLGKSQEEASGEAIKKIDSIRNTKTNCYDQ